MFRSDNIVNAYTLLSALYPCAHYTVLRTQPLHMALMEHNIHVWTCRRGLSVTPSSGRIKSIFVSCSISIFHVRSLSLSLSRCLLRTVLIRYDCIDAVFLLLDFVHWLHFIHMHFFPTIYICAIGKGAYIHAVHLMLLLFGVSLSFSITISFFSSAELCCFIGTQILFVVICLVLNISWS